MGEEKPQAEQESISIEAWAVEREPFSARHPAASDLMGAVVNSILILGIYLAFPYLSTHEIWLETAKLIPVMALLPLTNFIEKHLSPPTLLKYFFRALPFLCAVAWIFIPLASWMSPPDRMERATAVQIIDDHQPLLSAVIQEISIPRPVKEYTYGNRKTVLRSSDADQRYNTSRDIVWAHPDEPKSRNMMELFSLGNFIAVEKEGDLVVFYGGDYNGDLWSADTCFYYDPQDQPHKPIDRYNCALVSESENEWYYESSSFWGEEVSIKSVVVERIRQNWFFVECRQGYRASDDRP